MLCQNLLKKNDWKVLFIFFLMIIAFMPIALSGEISNETAARIIVSEGADQGLKGMICIAEVLRRRGSIKGFYGYKSNMIKVQSASIWAMADLAWKESAFTHYTKGADHFENIRRFGKPWWVPYCVKTYEYKDHVFYKEIRQHS